MYIPNREELAWAAGFYDGEGSFHSAPGKVSKAGSYKLYVTANISQATEEGRNRLLRFQSAVGGLGHVAGPYDQGKKPLYQWRSDKFEEVQAVVALLWFKLSSTKKAQATKVLRKAGRRVYPF